VLVVNPEAGASHMLCGRTRTDGGSLCFLRTGR
jgi:hypothetical protein